jgi:putative oxidoreductase
MRTSLRPFLLPEMNPRQIELGLLILRVGLGASLFAKHGLEKYTGWDTMMPHFPDPIGVGSEASYIIAFFSDGVCSLLVAAGLFTRWAALYVAGNVFVAWAFVHHFAFFAKNGGDHGEVCLMYIISFLIFFFAGGGSFSLDKFLASRCQRGP